MKYPDEVMFCVNYLRERGYLDEDKLMDIASKAEKLKKYYIITPITDGYWTELAKALRPLWPAGDKDGKWAWRDSVGNLASRLETLWRVRGLKEYPIATCVETANRYLARYRDNAKYMQVLKYFILKQKTIMLGDGKVKYVNTSVFADMLENVTDVEMQQEEWNKILEESIDFEQGRLV